MVEKMAVTRGEMKVLMMVERMVGQMVQ